METLKLSIGLVTRNRPESLERCLRSLHAQTPRPWEVIVSDDSSEGTEQVRSIVEKYGYRYAEGPRRGLYANRNHVAKMCSGTHLMTMDDDHEFPEGHLDACLTAVEEDGSAVWIVGEHYPGDEIGDFHACPGQLNPRGYSETPADPQNCWSISDGASIYPTEIFRSGIAYAEWFKFGAAYLEFGSRLRWLGYRMRHLDSTYVLHHMDLENRSYMDRQMQDASRYFAMLCHSFRYQRSARNAMLTLAQMGYEIARDPSSRIAAAREGWRAYARQMSEVAGGPRRQGRHA